MTERVTYEQVQRAMQVMPDLVDVIRMLRPQLEAMSKVGLMARHDRLQQDKMVIHWDLGN